MRWKKEKKQNLVSENEGYSPSNQNNQNNQMVGLQHTRIENEVQTTGETGYTGDSPSSGRLRKLSDVVFHKCVLCDLTPCEYEDERGRPVCELCAENCLTKQGVD